LMPVCLAFLDEAGDASSDLAAHTRSQPALAPRAGCADLHPSPAAHPTGPGADRQLEDASPSGGRRVRGELADDPGR
jgi:hypothetical protein